MQRETQVFMQTGSSSTRVDRQLTRERGEVERAVSRGRSAEARLRESGGLSRTAGGRAVLERHAEAVSIELGLLLERLIRSPYSSGPHHRAWPLLLETSTRGPRSLSAIALQVVIDQVAKGPVKKWKVQRAIGAALQSELRASRLERCDRQLCRLVQQRLGPRAAGRADVLRRLQLNPDGWALADRAEAGGLMLGLICSATGLAVDRGHLVVPTAELAKVACHETAGRAPIRRLPMLVPPRDWTGMTGGGHLGSDSPLVRTRKGLDLSHLSGEGLGPLVACVNYLQRQELRVNEEMARLQREAWDKGVAGLFPVMREPLQPPARPPAAAGREAMARWRAAAERASRDRCAGKASRVKTEEALRQAEQLAGESIWFAYLADSRGRIYTANRCVSNQGPDAQKGTIEFAEGKPCTSEGFDHLLRAAAGHWGVKDTLERRLAWGQANLDRIISAAADPFGTLDHWRPAKDPWQFLQVAMAVRQQAMEPAARCPCPIRLDQTCSGAAIAAALVRDERLARLTNLTGGGLEDLYAEVAKALVGILRQDVAFGTGEHRRVAEWWLNRGIDRSLVKPPTVAALMGGTWLGLVDILSAELLETGGGLEEWRGQIVAPSRFLAKRFQLALEGPLAPVRAIETWLRSVARELLPRGIAMEWTGPSGFRMKLGERHDNRSPVSTLTAGRHRWRPWSEPEGGGGLSARGTTPSLMPNVIHSFDAAFLHLVVHTCAESGVGLLVNHDCFAAQPTDAGGLHRLLLGKLRDMYAPDWLGRMHQAFAAQAPGARVPPPPESGELDISRIGENPNHFS